MIFVTHSLPVNVPGEPHLSSQNVWDGLVLKANNALPFVPSMTYCEVTQRHSDTVFDRDIALSIGQGRGQRFTERITLEASHRVIFTRIAGPVLGTIANEIEGAGGIGWFSRKYGLTCDNFESLELVLASGEVIEVNGTSHPELFWALRGGGGNFGIVTRFTFRAYDFGPMMRIGVSVYEPDQAAAALRGYAAMVPALPRTVGWHAALKHDMPALPFVPPEYVGKRLLMLVSMWLDDADAADGAELIGRLCEIGEPCIKATTVLPFAAGVQRLIDVEFEDGHRYYTKEAHVADLADEAIDKLVAFWRDMPMEGEVEIIGLGGAIGDVPEADAAFSNRGYLLWLNFAMRWDEPDRDPDYIGRTRAIVDDLAPWTGRGVYVNMLNFDELYRVVEALGGPEKYAELGRLKAQYDPENLFRMNYNIVPAG